jgi:hypothetical protein
LADQGVHIDFHFRGVGWADIHLRVHDKETTINGISYTTDALGDLLRAALMTATGAWTASASFDGEPYESRLVLLCGNWDSGKWRQGFFVRVLNFADIYQKQPDEEGIVSFVAECTGREFAIAVIELGNRILDKGIQNYAWGDMPFPMRALRALEAALANDDPPPPKSDDGEPHNLFEVRSPEEKS